LAVAYRVPKEAQEGNASWGSWANDSLAAVAMTAVCP
jgi:hypothetical protein